MGKKLFVGNLAFATTGSDLEAVFSTAGTVESASVISDRESGRIFGCRRQQRRIARKPARHSSDRFRKARRDFNRNFC